MNIKKSSKVVSWIFIAYIPLFMYAIYLGLSVFSISTLQTLWLIFLGFCYTYIPAKVLVEKKNLNLLDRVLMGIGIIGILLPILGGIFVLLNA